MGGDLEYQIDLLKSEAIEPRFFIGDGRFSLKAEDYSVRGVRAGGNPEPSGVLFDNSFTSYGVVLQAPRNERLVDSAVAGFNSRNGALDCLQFQGGKGKYRELSPVSWDNALLDKVIAVAVRAGLEAVMVVSSHDVECDPGTDHEKIVKRYDCNAFYFGMEFSSAEGRHILELASLHSKQIEHYRKQQASH